MTQPVEITLTEDEYEALALRCFTKDRDGAFTDAAQWNEIRAERCELEDHKNYHAMGRALFESLGQQPEKLVLMYAAAISVIAEYMRGNE